MALARSWITGISCGIFPVIHGDWLPEAGGMFLPKHPILISIDPSRIELDPKAFQPTSWDLKVVEQDLIRYVETARVIKGTPQLVGKKERVIAVNGIPFIKAALAVTPPIPRLVCLFEGEETLIIAHGGTPERPADLLNRNSGPLRAFESLGFDRRLQESEQRFVEMEIKNFYEDVRTDPSYFGGHYSKLDPLNWAQSEDFVTWSWEKSEDGDKHLLRFSETLGRIKGGLPLRSWNGFAGLDRSA